MLHASHNLCYYFWDSSVCIVARGGAECGEQRERILQGTGTPVSCMHGWPVNMVSRPSFQVQQHTLIRCSCLNIVHASLLTLTGHDAVGHAEIT